MLLNTENVQYRIFNTIEYRKKFQYRTSIVPKKKFNKNPRPNWKAKLESAYSFMLKYSKITVCHIHNTKLIEGSSCRSVICKLEQAERTS